MIKIGICDDEPIVCEILKKKVSICLAETKTEAEIECFYSGKELLDNIKKHFVETSFMACRDTKFALAGLGNDAGMYGCVEMLLD